MKYFIGFLVVLLMVLHHDVWNWNRIEPLVFGVIPVGLAHHVGISLAAGVVWFLAVMLCWPRSVDALERAASREDQASHGGPS